MAMKFLLIGVVCAGLVGCVQGHCRRKADQPGAAAPVDLPASPDAKVSSKDHVFVYKYDGSLQCGMGKPVSLETMAKELHGLPVISSVKKADGLMHIQVCGSITGMANVFELPAKYLKQAESRGFKKWGFE
jgi:hypothetical protein